MGYSNKMGFKKWLYGNAITEHIMYDDGTIKATGNSIEGIERIIINHWNLTIIISVIISVELLYLCALVCLKYLGVS